MKTLQNHREMKVYLFLLFISLGQFVWGQQLHGLPQTISQADTLVRPFEGHFHCKETGMDLYLNLYEKTLTAPGFDFLGTMHGYMSGNIYGTWMLTRHEIKGKTAHLRFSNDIGSDAQDIEFTQTSDSTYQYRATGGNAIRRAVGRKLVKVTDLMEFKRR